MLKSDLSKSSLTEWWENNKNDRTRTVQLDESQFLDIYDGEFDPGSGWTLAAGLIHARLGGSNVTVARVRNAYATYLSQGDSLWKQGLIPHKAGAPHGDIAKDLSVIDGHASD